LSTLNDLEMPNPLRVSPNMKLAQVDLPLCARPLKPIIVWLIL
jgi:hypothetical protein